MRDLQSNTLSTTYNYLLAFISKLQFISNIIYKLLIIIYKPRIIYKGYNNPYKQGLATTLHSYKYQVQSNPEHIPHTSTRANTPMHISVYRSLEPMFKHILALTPNSYIYLSVGVFYFVGPSSYPLNKGVSRNPHVKFGSPP